MASKTTFHSLLSAGIVSSTSFQEPCMEVESLRILEEEPCTSYTRTGGDKPELRKLYRMPPPCFEEHNSQSISNGRLQYIYYYHPFPCHLLGFQFFLEPAPTHLPLDGGTECTPGQLHYSEFHSLRIPEKENEE